MIPTKYLFVCRDEYYTLPPIDELNDRVSDDGECNVENFLVGREDYGEVKFLGITNVKDLNLDEIGKFFVLCMSAVDTRFPTLFH